MTTRRERAKAQNTQQSSTMGVELYQYEFSDSIFNHDRHSHCNMDRHCYLS